MRKTLVCEICKTDLMSFDPERVHLPLRGSMFDTLRLGWPRPDGMHPDVDWEWMRCPMCRKRPIIEEHRLYVRDGAMDQAFGYCEVKPDQKTAVSAPPVEAEPLDIDVKLPVREAEPPDRPIKSYVCPDCGKPCANYFGLMGHMRFKHKKEKTMPTPRRIEDDAASV